ncbi:hypothetical protein ACWGPQ_00010 [Saccharomonospora azurea]
MTAGKDATLSTDVTIGPDVGATIAGAVPLETTEVRSVGATSGTTGGADRVGSTIAQRGTGTTGVGSAGGTSGLDAGVTIVADSTGGMTGLDVGGTSVAVDLVETIAGSRVGAATTGVGSIGGMIGLDAGVMTVVDSIGGTRGVVGLVGMIAGSRVGAATTGVGSAGGMIGLDAGVTIVADSTGGMTGLDVGGTSVAVDLVETIAGSRVGAATTGVGSTSVRTPVGAGTTGVARAHTTGHATAAELLARRAVMPQQRASCCPRPSCRNPWTTRTSTSKHGANCGRCPRTWPSASAGTWWRRAR